MTLEQTIVAVVVALIGVAGGVLVERARLKRESKKEISGATATVETARLSDEASKRKEIDEAARDIREFLRKQVSELNVSIDRIEVARAGEREKWHQMLGTLSTKNLELELQHRRDLARIEEILEEAKVIDDEIRTLRVLIATYRSDAVVMTARLEAFERERLQKTKKGELENGSN